MSYLKNVTVLGLLVALSSTSSAFAEAPILGGLGGPVDYGGDCLSPNDDGSSASIDLTQAFPSGLKFFSDIHTTAFVNTNGNITFSGRLSTFTPRAFPVAEQPMIAPFWADVDIRQTGGSCMGSAGTTCTECSPCHEPTENGVWWQLEPGRMIITWDRVGYFSCRNDLRMSFQLILTSVPSCGGGATDFDVEFRFNRCEWETGNASGGTNGFGGTPAQSGFDAGNGMDFVMIPGSREAGISRKLCDESNIGDPGVWRYQIRSGVVICPEAGEQCDTGMTGVCGEGVTQCVGGGTECQPVVPASAEKCDALDNDCDGSTDEGEQLCGSDTSVCERGVCIDVCFEGGCGTGQICSDEGVCVDEACIDVTCEEGLRCSMGECIDACSVVRVGTGPDGANEIVDVQCPAGQSCRGGRCLDLCAEIECDPECTTCFDGECVGRCDLEGAPECPPGQTCTDNGLCVPTACVGVTCPAGQTCRGGGMACVDNCEGAVCPGNEICEEGECRLNMTEPPEDAGVDASEDAGIDAGEVDAGPIMREPDDCCTAAPGLGASRRAPLLVMLLMGLIFFRRRR